VGSGIEFILSCDCVRIRIADEVQVMKKVIRPKEAKDVAAQMTAEEIARFSQKRAPRADFEAFDRIMTRDGGAPPVEGDELPSTE
jgi:hypothetical protein